MANINLIRDNVCLLPIIAGTLTEDDIAFQPTDFSRMDFSLRPFHWEHISILLQEKLNKEQLGNVLNCAGLEDQFQCLWYDVGMIPRYVSVRI